ncbi:MAG: hypothetical protein Q7K98_07005 [Candidatus Omnitrophota bacterium]|nr:hypothetical protein [Candidatus Omnitrophota bacterium]
MAEGGFLVKFDGKEVTRCFAVAFDYDDWQYTINETEKNKLPAVKKIAIEVEDQELKTRAFACSGRLRMT